MNAGACNGPKSVDVSFTSYLLALGSEGCGDGKMKNHIVVDGRLVQTNKRFSDLKEKQKTKISEWSYEIYRAFFLEHGRLPRKNEDRDLLLNLQRRIDEDEIWIPGGEVAHFYYRRKNKLLKRLEKEFPEQFREPTVETANP